MKTIPEMLLVGTFLVTSAEIYLKSQKVTARSSFPAITFRGASHLKLHTDLMFSCFFSDIV